MSVLRITLPILACFWLSACSTFNAPAPIDPELKRAFIEAQVQQGFSPDEVTHFLDHAHYNQAVIDAINSPWEAKPWHQYYPIFLTDSRLEAGIAFWQKHASSIAKASQQYQVDPEIIVAILGIETFYGRFKGNYSVQDALYTLGFYYPARAEFFRKELGELMLLAKEEQLDIASLRGSYAGAMGYGQFISSSYRYYGVDFDGDGKRDLINSPIDAIGSIANYLHLHGWQMQAPIALALTHNGDPTPMPLWQGEKITSPIYSLLSPALTLTDTQAIDLNQAAILIALEQAEKTDYWLGLQNFYAITRYNHSPLYAMAVYQFSQQLKQHYAAHR